jgi:hypothetical protein
VPPHLAIELIQEILAGIPGLIPQTDRGLLSVIPGNVSESSHLHDFSSFAFNGLGDRLAYTPSLVGRQPDALDYN